MEGIKQKDLRKREVVRNRRLNQFGSFRLCSVVLLADAGSCLVAPVLSCSNHGCLYIAVASAIISCSEQWLNVFYLFVLTATQNDTTRERIL